MNAEIVIPSRIAGRVSIQRGEYLPLRDFYGGTVTLSAAYRGQEVGTVTYMLTLRRDAPEFEEDFEDFLVLKARLLTAMVREGALSVKRLSYIDHRVIDEYATPEDRRFIRREYLMRKVAFFDNDDWNDAGPTPPAEAEAKQRRW